MVTSFAFGRRLSMPTQLLMSTADAYQADSVLKPMSMAGVITIKKSELQWY